MYTESIGSHKRVKILPGELYVSSQPVVISTLLGSCIAACLYDPRRKVMGMNHFLISGNDLSSASPASFSEAGRYGVHAMELLINEMMRQGADRYNLRAKVFGGSTMLGSTSYRVGEKNGQFILEFLALENIPVEAQDLGGEHGRVIHFCYGDFSVYVRKLRPDRNADLVKRDRLCWSNALKKQAETQSSAELWE